jgi:olefin beta-lactone synthetase
MNIAQRIRDVSKELPNKKSVVFSQRVGKGYEYPFYTFSEFESRSNQMAHYFREQGISKGMRVLLFVRPCLDFSVITFSLFKLGAVPVLIDPGMGVKNLLGSIQQVKPEALVSVGEVHWLRRFKKSFFTSVKIKISLSPVGGRTSYLYENLSGFPKSFELEEMSSEDPSAILFTSGGTGIPKGVVYTHGILNSQTDLLQEMFKLTPRDIDLPGFPLFALFTLAMGMTSVIPDLDPTKPAQCDPAKIVQNILHSQATFVAGSPSIWERVGKYCLSKNIQLGSVKYVVMFGAPVRFEIHQMFQKILPFGDTYTPYGATESLPVTLISGRDVLTKVSRTLQGSGVPIGRAVPQTEIMILKTTDIPEMFLQEEEADQVGEIVVRGNQVTRSYFEMKEETSKAKIIEEGILWHRMGDLGHLDAQGDLWFLGRKTHRVQLPLITYYPLEIEPIFNQHPEVKRVALVKLNKLEKISAALVIERRDGETKASLEFFEELKELGKSTAKTSVIQDFFLHPGFPVDVRHNIKIDRIKLGLWASEQKLCQKNKNRKSLRSSISLS